MTKPKKSLKHRKRETGNKGIGIAFFVVLVAASGFALWATSSQGNVDTGGIDLPNYAYRTTSVTQAYVASVDQPQLFEYIPCYCGCGMSADHRYLRDCFYDDYGQFSQHGANCNICIDIATTSWSMYREGASLLEIRNTIDNKYATGDFPPPTKTLMPPM